MPHLDEPVHLVAHDPRWSGLFEEERVRIAKAADVEPERIEHIGSTAVRGLLAKPVIDVMLGCTIYPVEMATIEALVLLGYENLGEAGVEGRQYFRLRGVCSYNVHAVAFGSSLWLSNLLLRDFLRANPSARARYEVAKIQAVRAGATTLLSYSQSKAAVVGQLLAEATRAHGDA